jgi:hypothetical protein
MSFSDYGHFSLHRYGERCPADAGQSEGREKLVVGSERLLLAQNVVSQKL